MWNFNPVQIILTNILICVAYHLIFFVLCVKLNTKYFDYKRPLYRTRKWEKNGEFYVKYLKIKVWKDHIPQHVGKNGFSKKNLSIKDLSNEYLDLFLIETCRAEWTHSFDCLYFIIAFIINPIGYALLFSIPVLLFNGACIAIQRYNRIRILELKDRLSKKKLKKSIRSQVNTKNALICDK